MITSQGFGLIAELIARSVADRCAYGLHHSAVPTLVGRRHGGTCDTYRSRDDNHQLICLSSKLVGHDPFCGMSALHSKAHIVEHD
jgi:hypothetical protein